ncbi:zeatin O-glucosyltransferase-like [Salvia miltiorrhiza]|uniref:zeatin O-glucosyltransferase-like n=1 Tax=Salvia miltiorrhiza TaxID=226208 RepID=UPI0025AD297F|nr:zeatin O-glucosyltransferase-like [Salvia miltiorrhiza]
MAKSKVAVVIVPLPAQSHLNQLLHLGAVLSSRGLPVHFVGSATHNRQVRLRAAGLKPSAAAKIKFHDFPTSPIAAPEPDTTTADKLPIHLAPAVTAYMELSSPICSLVRELSVEASKIAVIYDRLVSPVVKDAVAIENVESYAFSCLSALNLFCVFWENLGRPFDVAGEINRWPSVTEFFPESTLKFIATTPAHFDERCGDIYNTSRLIEAKYIDLLRREEIGGGKKQFAIWPIWPRNLHYAKSRHECLEWLDRQSSRSVIYVSFGSSISMTKEEIGELAAGLEQSGEKFIWVVREADRADIFAGEGRGIELPLGFEERVRERGIVVRDWAPQLEILAHRSTGGFMTHCGWNSCFESMIYGVPVAAWPMHSDQPLNAILLTEVLGIGVVVREWEAREEVVGAAVIEDVVGRLLSTEEGAEIRKRAEEVSAAVRKSMEEGGELCRELDCFIAHITR